jgi:hypothetical protein
LVKPNRKIIYLRHSSYASIFSACASNLSKNLHKGTVAKVTKAITFNVKSTFEESLNKPDKTGAEAPENEAKETTQRAP